MMISITASSASAVAFLRGDDRRLSSRYYQYGNNNFNNNKIEK